MKYDGTIVNIDEDEITVKIRDIYITGFANTGVVNTIGQQVTVDITLFDDLEISETSEGVSSIIRKGDLFAYSLFGILDIDNSILKSVINFDIDKEELFNYGYLDGKMVKVDVIRIDFDIE